MKEIFFLFHVKNQFCSQDINAFVWLFGYVEKRLVKKVNLKIKRLN